VVLVKAEVTGSANAASPKKPFDAIIAIGVLIKGATMHFVVVHPTISKTSPFQALFFRENSEQPKDDRNARIKLCQRRKPEETLRRYHCHWRPHQGRYYAL
jgi:hypothetical protein